MTRIVLAVSLLLAVVVYAAPKRYPVGVGPKPAHALMAATAPGGSLTVARGQVTVNADGSATIALSYANAGGNTVSIRALTVPVSGAVTDQFGNVVSATVPAALATAISTFAAQLDSMVAAAATGGKLNL